jgi:predicted amidohydrolase YtcJ
MLTRTQNIHCIGDRANHVVLDILERLIASDPTRDARPRIEHAQIMTQDDLQRIGSLGGARFALGRAADAHADAQSLPVSNRRMRKHSRPPIAVCN